MGGYYSCTTTRPFVWLLVVPILFAPRVVGPAPQEEITTCAGDVPRTISVGVRFPCTMVALQFVFKEPLKSNQEPVEFAWFHKSSGGKLQPTGE